MFMLSDVSYYVVCFYITLTSCTTTFTWLHTRVCMCVCIYISLSMKKERNFNAISGHESATVLRLKAALRRCSVEYGNECMFSSVILLITFMHLH